MASKEDLKPCPFCSGDAETDTSYQVGVYYGCHACDIWQLGIEAWNRRATPEQSSSSIESEYARFEAWYGNTDARFWNNWDACKAAWQAAMQVRQVPDGMIDRIKSAQQRIHDNHAPRRIPADPTDVDLVLVEVEYFLTGKWPPFWIKDTAPLNQIAASPKEQKE